MDNGEKVIVNWYLVAFLDVLGQKQKLRDLRALPNNTNKDELNSFIAVLKNTAGVVEGLRDLFHTFFESHNKPSFNIDDLAPKQKELYKKLKGNSLKSHMFSDFLSMSLSLRDDENKVPMSGVYSVLVSAASLCLTMLAGGKPIRGGIDVGIGLELKNGDIYGSAVSRAYEIESKISNFPRIVLGDEVIRYIQAQSIRPENTPFDSMNKELAIRCRKFIAKDQEGNLFLDYLGNEFKKNIGNNLPTEIIEKSYKFVLQELEKWKAAKNSTLESRYELLKKYFESRLHYWIKDIDKLTKSVQQGHAL